MMIAVGIGHASAVIVETSGAAPLAPAAAD